MSNAETADVVVKAVQSENSNCYGNRRDPLVLGDCRFNDATGLPGGDSRFFLASIGFVTLDATGLPGGGSRFGVAGILTAFKA